MVKSLIKSSARILLAYFIALPVLFTSHAFLHEHLDHKGLDVDFEITAFSDCGLCDLYHSQTAVLTLSVDQNEESFHSFFESYGIDNTILQSPDILHLRGPPLS